MSHQPLRFVFKRIEITEEYSLEVNKNAFIFTQKYLQNLHTFANIYIHFYTNKFVSWLTPQVQKLLH